MTIEEMLKETGTKCDAPMEHKEDAPKRWKCPVRARLADRCAYCGKFTRKGEMYCKMHQP